MRHIGITLLFLAVPIFISELIKRQFEGVAGYHDELIFTILVIVTITIAVILLINAQQTSLLRKPRKMLMLPAALLLAGPLLLLNAFGLEYPTQYALALSEPDLLREWYGMSDITNYRMPELDVGLVLLFSIIASCIAMPILEELLFRGYLELQLRKKLGRTNAMLVTGATFCLLHPPRILSSFINSICFSMARDYSNSLWVPILMHMSINLSANMALYIFTFPWALEFESITSLSTWMPQLILAVFAIPLSGYLVVSGSRREIIEDRRKVLEV